MNLEACEPKQNIEILKDACVSDNLELQLKLKVAHNNEYPRDKKGLYQKTPVQPIRVQVHLT